MSRYLTKLVSLPVKKLAEYLIERFLGKFVGKIDLNREGTSFNKETLTLPDLNLNCRVSRDIPTGCHDYQTNLGPQRGALTHSTEVREVPHRDAPVASAQPEERADPNQRH